MSKDRFYNGDPADLKSTSLTLRGTGLDTDICLKGIWFPVVGVHLFPVVCKSHSSTRCALLRCRFVIGEGGTFFFASGHVSFRMKVKLKRPVLPFPKTSGSVLFGVTNGWFSGRRFEGSAWLSLPLSGSPQAMDLPSLNWGQCARKVGRLQGGGAVFV